MNVEHRIAHEEIVHTKLNDSQMRENLNVAMHTLQKKSSKNH